MREILETRVFPFGERLNRVTQVDRTRKKVFVLGVYASAVHARWVNASGRVTVRALAVASEPSIFWRGEGAAEIVGRISIPREVGRLIPAEDGFNGPSGRALDEYVLKPLGISRDAAWLCDLVPHSCVNPEQQKAIARAYTPIAAECGLPCPSIPQVPKQLANDERRKEILDEVFESDAEVLILLGDEPIRWFLHHYDSSWQRLSDFQPYGSLHRVKVWGRSMLVLPLAHPRQVARLGRHSKTWFDAHRRWIAQGGVKLVG